MRDTEYDKGNMDSSNNTSQEIMSFSKFRDREHNLMYKKLFPRKIHHSEKDNFTSGAKA